MNTGCPVLSVYASCQASILFLAFGGLMAKMVSLAIDLSKLIAGSISS